MTADSSKPHCTYCSSTTDLRRIQQGESDLICEDCFVPEIPDDPPANWDPAEGNEP